MIADLPSAPVESGRVSAPAGDVPPEEPTGDAADVSRHALDPDSVTWVTGLSCTGPHRDTTVERLHGVLVKIARSEANRRSGLHGIAGQELEDLAHQAAADALVSILRKVEEFRGESKFTTWAYKFVIFEISNKFARHVWRRDGGQLDDEAWDRLPAALGADPGNVTETRELVGAVHRAVEEILTAHQRKVFVAIVLNGMPLDALVAEMDSNRNAIYKTLFDARRKLHRHLVEQGLIEPQAGRR